MEEFDVKEIHSVSSTTVQFDNAISWSEDHKISLLSASSLHVFEVAPNTSVSSGEMCVKKSIIEPPNGVATADSGMDVNHLIYRLEQRSMYRMVLDMKLAPFLSDGKPPEPRFICAQWSPASMYQEHKCMLATLTCTGCLKMYVPYFYSWVEVYDLSRCWVEKYCKKLWKENLKEHPDSAWFEILNKRTSMMKITGLVWGHLGEFSNRRYSYIATISHGGMLAIWKVDHLADLGIPVQDFQPQMLKMCETRMYNARALHWTVWNKNEISVIIGDAHGYVKMATFSLNESENTVSLLSINDVWNEKDQMQISCIKSFPHSAVNQEQTWIIGVTKNSYILVFLITQNTVLSYCHDHIGGLPLAGLEVHNNAFVTCTFSGLLCKYSIHVHQSAENVKISMCQNILKSNLSLQDVGCFGIAKSCNDEMWTICTNLCKTYDHLVTRRPSQVVFFTIGDSSKENVNEIAAKIGASKLRFHSEKLEIFRLHYLKLLKTQSSKDLQLGENLDKMTTSQLQMELWRARIMYSHFAVTDALLKNPDVSAYISLLEEIILCRHACKYIGALVERHKECPLDEENLCTVGILQFWLQTWFSHNRSLNNAFDKNEKIVTSETNGVSNPKEKEVAMEVDLKETIQKDGTSSESDTVANASENVCDNDATSVGSFDDAISSDSNSSSVVPDKPIISKKVQIPHGRVPASFLKVKLSATFEQVSKVLALPVIPGVPEKELCAFCEQEVKMDIDWRWSVCPANHRLSRCCQCLRRCNQMPSRSCMVCPAVACVDIDNSLEPFCTFCDSPLIVDDKFKKPGFSPPSEVKEEEKKKEEEQKKKEEEDEEEDKEEEKKGEEEKKEKKNEKERKMKEENKTSEEKMEGINTSENENNLVVSMEG